jgi:hypothetical protein
LECINKCHETCSWHLIFPTTSNRAAEMKGEREM